ncbi:MAG: glycosyltransferase family 4 protein [Chloroflexota bacterium]
MNIGLILDPVNKLTGPANYLANLLVNFQEMNKHRFYYFVPRWKESCYTSNETLISLPGLPIMKGRALSKYNLDIIHLNVGMLSNPLDLLHYLCFSRSARRIITVHGNEMWVIPRYLSNPSRLNILRRRYSRRLVGKTGDHFIAVSNYLKGSLMTYEKIPENRITVIYEGIDTALFKKEPQERVQEFIRQKGIEWPYLLHISNWAPKKNSSTLLYAYAELKRQGVEHKLVVAGGKWDRTDVHSLVAKLELEEEVVFLNHLSQQDLVLLYNAADLFVFPSLHETFGFPILEAMACGCPVITSNTTAIPEVAGDAALLLNDPQDANELSDKMSRVLGDPNLRQQMKDKGLERVQQFSWESCARQTMDTYEKVYRMESRCSGKEVLATVKSITRSMVNSIRK